MNERINTSKLAENAVQGTDNQHVKSVIALNPKHQSLVNKVVAWDTKYELANDQRTLAYDLTEFDFEEDDKTWRKWNRACENAYDKYLTYFEELPKREQLNITKTLSI